MDDLLTKRIDEQPLNLYQFTTNQNYTSHEQVRKKIISNYLNITSTNLTEINSTKDALTKRENIRTQRNISSKESTHSMKSRESEENRMRRQIIMEKMGADFDTNFEEGEDLKIESKYMNEIINMMSYKTSEVSEKILLVNEDSKNFISSILENTFFNIISEAVFGETDLSEKSKIYFLKDNN